MADSNSGNSAGSGNSTISRNSGVEFFYPTDTSVDRENIVDGWDIVDDFGDPDANNDRTGYRRLVEYTPADDFALGVECVSNSYSRIDREEYWSLEKIRKDIRESGIVKIDGLMILGSSWNFTTINGQVTVGKSRIIQREQASSFKGVPEILANTYFYVYDLCTIDNGQLVLLMSSKYPETGGGKSKRVVYCEMVAELENVLKSAILSVDGKTKWDFLSRADGKLVIAEENWAEIGSILQDKLGRLSKEQKKIFPLQTKFDFGFRKFGQDQLYYPGEMEIEHRFPHIRLQNADKVVVHLAYDQHVEGHYLFFNSKFPERVGVNPTHVYNIGLIPRTSNFVYSEVPENEHGISAMQQYTRLFHSVHRNEHGYFSKPFIARKLLQAYCAKINGEYRRDVKDYMLRNILDGNLDKMHSGIRQALSDMTPVTRTEFVWSRTNAGREGEIATSGRMFVEDAINAAYEDVMMFLEEKRCCDADLYTIGTRDVVLPYLLRILSTLFATIERGRVSMNLFLSTLDVLEEDALQNCLELQDFVDIYVSEALLRRMLRGDIGKFSPLVERCIRSHVIGTSENDEDAEQNAVDLFLEIDIAWPFNRTLIWDEEGVLKTRILISSIWRDFELLFGLHQKNKVMAEVYPFYKKWVSTSSSVTGREKASASLFKHVAYALIQCTLLLNGLKADNNLSLWKLWNGGKVQKQVRITVSDSISIYKKLLEINVRTTAGLKPAITFLQLLKCQMSDKIDGGCQMALACAFDEIMVELSEPFLLRMPNRAKLTAFLPVTFAKCTDTIIRLYKDVFVALHHRSVGRKNINIHRYLAAILPQMSCIFTDERPGILKGLFEILNKLMDDNSVKQTQRFTNLPPCLARAIEEIDNGPEVAYFAQPLPRGRQDLLGDIRSNAIDVKEGAGWGTGRPLTRLEVRRRQQEQNVTIDEFIFPGGIENYLLEDGGVIQNINEPCARLNLEEHNLPGDNESEHSIRPLSMRPRRNFVVDSSDDEGEDNDIEVNVSAAEHMVTPSSIRHSGSSSPIRDDSPRPPNYGSSSSGRRHDNPVNRRSGICFPGTPCISSCSSGHEVYSYDLTPSISSLAASIASPDQTTVNVQRVRNAELMLGATSASEIEERLPDDFARGIRPSGSSSSSRIRIDTPRPPHSRSSASGRRHDSPVNRRSGICFPGTPRISSSSSRHEVYSYHLTPGTSSLAASIASPEQTSVNIQKVVRNAELLSCATSASENEERPQEYLATSPTLASSLSSPMQTPPSTRRVARNLEEEFVMSEKSSYGGCRMGAQDSHAEFSVDEFLNALPEYSEEFPADGSSETVTYEPRVDVIQTRRRGECADLPYLSDLESENGSTISRGLLFRGDKRKMSGTPYDHVIYNPDCTQPSMARVPRVSTPRNFPHLMYTLHETKSIFKWMAKERWLVYMKGTAISWLMSRLKVVNRPPQSISNHIKAALRKKSLRSILGDSLYEKVREADKRITECKGTNYLPRDKVKRRFDIDLPAASELLKRIE